MNSTDGKQRLLAYASFNNNHLMDCLDWPEGCGPPAEVWSCSLLLNWQCQDMLLRVFKHFYGGCQQKLNQFCLWFSIIQFYCTGWCYVSVCVALFHYYKFLLLVKDNRACLLAQLRGCWAMWSYVVKLPEVTYRVSPGAARGMRPAIKVDAGIRKQISKRTGCKFTVTWHRFSRCL